MLDSDVHGSAKSDIGGVLCKTYFRIKRFYAIHPVIRAVIYNIYVYGHFLNRIVNGSDTGQQRVRTVIVHDDDIDEIQSDSPNSIDYYSFK